MLAVFSCVPTALFETKLNYIIFSVDQKCCLEKQGFEYVVMWNSQECWALQFLQDKHFCDEKECGISLEESLGSFVCNAI